MASRRHGRPNAYWDGASVSEDDVSAPVAIGRGADNFVLYIKSSGVATFQLQIGHMGGDTTDGTDPDTPTNPATDIVWHDLWYLGTSGTGNSTNVTVNFTGAGAIGTIVPDFGSKWTRLRRTDAGTAVTVTAGFEAQGD